MRASRRYHVWLVSLFLSAWMTSLSAQGAATRAWGDRLVLVADGISRAPIIVADSATPRTHEAAAELAEYIGKISGAKPEIIRGEPTNAPASAIWVGYQPRLKALFPNTDFDFKHPEEILIQANASHLVIAGRDRWDPARPHVNGKRGVIENLQQESGTINAIYTFAQDQLGVRWLWPGDLGTDIPHRPTIALRPFTTRTHPQFRERDGLFYLFSLTSNYRGGMQDWLKRQRILFDSLAISGGHAFVDWWQQYGEEHPEYFAVLADGSRKPLGDGGRYTKICEANPAVWQQWMRQMEQQAADDPRATVFSAAANDGWGSGHCTCAHCAAWSPAESNVVEFCLSAKGDKIIPLSDRQVKFANTLAAMVRARFPDKDYNVSIAAYGYSRPKPVIHTPADNVLILSVNNFLFRGDDEREKPISQFKGWAGVSQQVVWRPNTGSPAGWQWGTTDVALRQVAGDMRLVAEHGGIGVFVDALWGHWASQGPVYYLMAQLAWDPYADASRLMADYTRRAYGPAAADMQAYWTFMEDTRQRFVDDINNDGRRFLIHTVYTNAVFDRARGILDRAAQIAKTVPGPYAQRVAFTRTGLDYTEHVVKIRGEMEAFEKGKGREAEAARARVLALWDRMAEFKSAAPEYAVNWQRVFRTDIQGDSSGGRMLGLHPDNVLSGPKLRKYLKAQKAEGLE